MDTKNYKTLIEEMKASAIAGGSGLTDFNEGSVIMTIFESVARPIEQGYIDTRNGYANNLRAIPYSIFDFQQKVGQKASVSVVFTRNSAASFISIIPSGTRVSNGSLFFTTTETANIQVGEIESNSVEAIAENIGLEYNVAANTVTTLESTLSAEIVGVNNPYKATGGTDAETQTQMLRRFKNMINGLQGSNKYGITAGVLGIEGVRSVSIEEHFPPKSNIYNFTVYVDDGTGRLTEDLKNKCVDLINGDDTESNPGLRAAGINVDVQAAAIVSIEVAVTATIYRVEAARIQNDITTKLQQYINGLGIHENVVLSSIVVLLKQINGITDISGLTLNESTENISIGINQIARFENVTITIINQ
ncbi:MAG: baseplate J/gp47 family protein [Treponema sp.]|nr:baseplate J/gp47 family protein [Treponema sp.]